jgi:autotransporter-associated beta strand protein
MATTKQLKISWFCAVALGFGFGNVQAASVTNLDAAVNLNLGGSWVGGTPAGSGDIAVWNNVVAANPAKSLGADLSWAGIQILDPGAAVSINNGNTLTIGAFGIDMSAASQDFSLNNSNILGANQIWNVAGGRTLSVASAGHPGLIKGSASLAKNGNGTLVLRGLNSYNGGTVVNGGILQINSGTTGTGTSGTNSAGIGGLTLNNGATLQFGAAVNMGNTFTVNGTVIVDMNTNGGSTLMNGSWFSSGGTVIITNAISGTTFTIGGNGVGGGNMNNFTGAVVMASITSQGVTASNSLRLNDSGGNNNTGNANASFDLGNGVVNLTARNRLGNTMNLGSLSGGATTIVKIGSSGAAGTTYSVGGLNTSTTFNGIFDGTGTTANMFLALTKVGSGVFTLTGSNTYNGTTAINAGVLLIGNGGTSGQLGTGGVVNNASLVFNRSDAITVSNAMSGSGSVIKTNSNIMTYAGTNSSSGTTTVSQGTLAIGTSGLMSCPVFVAGGATFDVSQVIYNLSSTLSGFGTVTGLVTAVSGGNISPGGSGQAGTLNFSNNVAESGGVNHTMELSSVGSTNDLINIVGDLTVTGTNTINLSHFGGGTIPNGTYTLFTYSGNFNGGTTNFTASGVGNIAVVTNDVANQIRVVITQTPRGATNLTWVGDGGANIWDIGISNWISGATSFAFQTGDSVRFDAAGAANPTVNLNVSVSPASVVVSNTASYTFAGGGSISGATGLVKTNSGTLNVQTTNSYTGPTTIGGGMLVVSSLANGGTPSGIGAASSNPTNLVFFGTTLSYTGLDASTDRGATLNGFGGIFTVPVSTTLELDGIINGTGALIKSDAGTLTINDAVFANNYSGGTVISNGVLALGGNTANSSGLGTNTVTFYGGTLQLFGYNGSTANNYSSPQNTMVVPAGQTGTVQMFPRGPNNASGLASKLIGAGTFNLVVNYVRDNIGGDWSAFTGLINVTGKNISGDEFRIDNAAGFSNAVIYLNSGVIMDRANTANATIDIGELGGTNGAIIGPGTGSAANPTWRVGWKNTTNVFSGTIANDGTASSITKVGTGTWILSGQNTYSGSTIVSNGVLALVNDPVSTTDGSISSSTNILIKSGAFLEVIGRSDATMPLNSGQVIGGEGTIRGILDTTAGGTVSPGGGIEGSVGTLTVTNHINLGGTAWIKLNRGVSPNSDKLSAPSIVLGGALVVTNIGAALHVGDSFTLFTGTLSGTFNGNVTLPSGYTWNTNLLEVNGTISVTGIAAGPVISSVDYSQLSSGTLTFNATGGVPGEPFSILTSTNLTLPLASWTTAQTGNFDGSGNITRFSVTVNPELPQSFFILAQ